MKKICLILCFFLINSTSIADSLGTNKTVNDYIENGYQLQSVRVINENKYLYSLVNDGSENKIFEPKLVSCVYNLNNHISECFKP